MESKRDEMGNEIRKTDNGNLVRGLGFLEGDILGASLC